jgi:hypothetical protein
LTTEAALAGLAGSVALYVAAAMVDRRLEIALVRRSPPEWAADPRLGESREGWQALSVADLFRNPGWAARWLLAIGVFALVFIPLGVHWWIFALVAVLYAGSWVRSERAEAVTWGRRLREEHGTSPAPRKLKLLSELRWFARFVKWLAFIAAPAFAAAAIVALF